MPANEANREDELRDLLTEAITVQLAALKAGISFWEEWVEQASAFVESATDTLSAINSGDRNTDDALLDLLDRARASARAMTLIPQHAATRFLEELDAAGGKRPVSGKSGRTKKTSGHSTTGRSGARKPRPKRAARAKE
ncbi:MAG: hypothetical protein L0I62_04235 [Gammaproteobacteria bacterium]|nr:hypothetical protein [Gammaproteobacteria bacterium]